MFQLDANTFGAAVIAVLNKYEGYSDHDVVAAQGEINVLDNDSISALLVESGYADYECNVLDDIGYVVFKVRGITWKGRPLQTHLPTAKLDQVASLILASNKK